MNWNNQNACFEISSEGGFKLARCLVEGKPVFVLSNPDMDAAEYYLSEGDAKRAAESKVA